SVEVPAIGADDVDDLPALATQIGQVGGLVLRTLAAKEVAVVFGHPGVWACAAGYLECQRGEVRALDMVVEVGGRENQATVRRLHHCVSIISSDVQAASTPTPHRIRIVDKSSTKYRK